MSSEASTGRMAAEWTPRLDARLLVGLVLVALALAGGTALWGQAKVTAPVVIAARDLPAGHLLAAGDLTVTEAKLDGAPGTLAIPAAELQSLLGRTTGDRVHAGALLLRAQLGTGPVVGPEDVAVTVPVESNTVYPALRPGDEVAVLATSERGKAQSRTVTLLGRALVLEVGGSASRVSLGGGRDESGPPANVTLVVPQAEAERVAHGLVNETLTLVLLAPASGSPGGE